jgi:hypothetical protein
MGLLDLAAERWLTRKDRRRESVPLVLANEVQAPTFFTDSPSGWAAEAYVENRGSIEAMNVTFGVEFFGVHHAYRLTRDERASRLNVVRPGERAPASGAYRIPIESLAVYGGEGDADDRVYWCRYQAPSRDWWETLNPAQRDGRMIVRRLRRPEAAEDRDVLERAEAMKRGEGMSNDMAAEMRKAKEKELGPDSEHPPHPDLVTLTSFAAVPPLIP